MKKLEIRNLGPIKECKIELNSFNVITGKQSAGKSTIAKCLFFFLSLKDILGRLAFECHHPGALGDGNGNSLNTRFKNYIQYELDGTFGVRKNGFSDGMLIRMNYTDNVYILVQNNKSLKISYSNELRDFVKSIENKSGDSLEKSFNDSLQKEIDDFFQMDYSPIYIPAGRSLMTVMGSQFEFFYSTLDDNNKELIDLCTRNYFETVMRLKPLYGKGLSQLWKNTTRNDVLKKAQPLIRKVMNADYYYSRGDEFLQLDNGKNVRINLASSGQQEALWIYNILLYYTVDSIKKFYIIEEPESNLFPESQQYITKFLGLIANAGNMMLINTHSPYVLGELNNMIYAGGIIKDKKKVYEIIEKECLLKFESTGAFFVEDGLLGDCMDYEIKQIDNSKLDAISEVINEEFDRLLEIEKGK